MDSFVNRDEGQAKKRQERMQKRRDQFREQLIAEAHRNLDEECAYTYIEFPWVSTTKPDPYAIEIYYEKSILIAKSNLNDCRPGDTAWIDTSVESDKDKIEVRMPGSNRLMLGNRLNVQVNSNLFSFWQF